MLPLNKKRHTAPSEQYWHGMSRKQKMGYLWDYYKLQMMLIAVAVCLLFSGIFHYYNKKTTLLAVACVNVNAGEETVSNLTDRFLLSYPSDTRNPTVSLQNHLTLVSPSQTGSAYEYAYASELKLMAMITDQALDVVLMDEKALHVFSDEGYLMQLTPGQIKTLSEGSVPVELCPAQNAVCLGSSGIARTSGFSGTVYAGIIKNTQRPEAAVSYLRYLLL